MKISRRTFLKGSATLGGALALGLEGKVNQAHALEVFRYGARQVLLTPNLELQPAPEVLAMLAEPYESLNSIQSRNDGRIVGSVSDSTGDKFYMTNTGLSSGRQSLNLDSKIGDMAKRLRSVKRVGLTEDYVFDWLTRIHKIDLFGSNPSENRTDQFKQFYGFHPTDMLSFRYEGLPSPPGYHDNVLMLKKRTWLWNLYLWENILRGDRTPLWVDFDAKAYFNQPVDGLDLAAPYNYGVISVNGLDRVVGLHRYRTNYVGNHQTNMDIWDYSPGVRFGYSISKWGDSRDDSVPIHFGGEVSAGDRQLIINEMREWHTHMRKPSMVLDDWDTALPLYHFGIDPDQVPPGHGGASKFWVGLNDPWRRITHATTYFLNSLELLTKARHEIGHIYAKYAGKNGGHTDDKSVMDTSGPYNQILATNENKQWTEDDSPLTSKPVLGPDGLPTGIYRADAYGPVAFVEELERRLAATSTSRSA